MTPRVKCLYPDLLRPVILQVQGNVYQFEGALTLGFRVRPLLNPEP